MITLGILAVLELLIRISASLTDGYELCTIHDNLFNLRVKDLEWLAGPSKVSLFVPAQLAINSWEIEILSRKQMRLKIQNPVTKFGAALFVSSVLVAIASRGVQASEIAKYAKLPNTLVAESTWTVLASIATITEAIAVVVSVFFIWRELHENTRLTKAANSQSLVELSSPFNLQLIQDRQMAEFWVLGPQNYKAMDEVDKYRYQALLVWWLILHENIFYQKGNNLLDESTYKGWDNDLKVFVRHHHLWLHWNTIGKNFYIKFADHVNSLIEEFQPTTENPSIE